MTKLFPALLLCLPVTSFAAQELPTGFGWFGAMAGSCWVGRFPDGRTEHTQCYTSQFGKFLRGTASLASVKEGARHITFHGDSVFGWDEASKRIVYYIWASDGSHRQLHASYSGDELHFPVTSRTEPSEVLYRSVWRRVDADTLEVRRERPKGDQWSTELTVTYRRASPAGARSK
jgi:hypothetical protein